MDQVEGTARGCGRDITVESGPEKLMEGWFGNPIVTPDGQWIVVGKVKGRSWAEPNNVVRINLDSREETVIDVPAADNFWPVAYIAERDKVLLCRCRDEPDEDDTEDSGVGPVEMEHRLLDPATGQTEIVAGEFRPWHSLTYRPLQPAKKNGRVWAAVPDREESSTAVGLFDTARFNIDPIMTVPSVCFDSMDMWVDDDQHLVYVAINGDLLRFPLPAAIKAQK